MLLDDLPIWGYVGEVEEPGMGSDADAEELEHQSGSELQRGPGESADEAVGAVGHAMAADNGTRHYLFTHLDFSLA